MYKCMYTHTMKSIYIALSPYIYIYICTHMTDRLVSTEYLSIYPYINKSCREVYLAEFIFPVHSRGRR